MLEFINNNGVLFSGIFAVLAALATALLNMIRDKQKIKNQRKSALEKELLDVKKELAELKDFKKKERMIDKSEGSIYVENLHDGKKRDICGFCWEKEHITIPVVKDLQYEEYTKQYYYSAYCNVCKNHCLSNIENNMNDDISF